MTKIQEAARDIQDKYGWNLLPLGQFVRAADGKKEVQFLASYTQYRDKVYPIEQFPANTQHILIMTGYLSNLTIIDIDSTVALLELEEFLQDTVDNYCNYIIATTKGFQLFYTYTPELKSIVKYQQSDIDVLNDGYQTFASPLNPGYTVLKEEAPQPVPEKILEFFSNIETINAVSDNIRKSNESYYVEPFVEVVEQFIAAKSISSKLKATLEAKLCRKEFEGHTLDEFGKGNRSTFLARVAALLSADPTISKEAFEAFMLKLNIQYTKMPDLEFSKRYISRYTHNKATVVDDMTGEYLPLWSYNPQWELEHEKHISNTMLQDHNYKVWRDLEDSKYALYHIPSNSAALLAKQMLLDQLKHMGERVGDDGIQTSMFPAIATVFDPTKPSPFFKDEFGREYYNSFKRTPMMEHFLTATSRDTLPPFIAKVLANIMPETDTRELFLHNLAHHLRYLHVGMTAQIFIGQKGGEGKGVILDELISLIYGDYYSKVSTKTFTSNFNGELKNKLFVYLDESDGKFNDTLLENLKRIIGNSTYELRVKNKGTTNTPNNMLIAISSNKDVPVTLDSNRDRRFNVSVTRPIPLIDYEWFREVKKTVSVKRQLENEIKGFIEYLAGLKTTDIQYAEIIENEARSQLKENSMTTIEVVVEYLLAQDFAELRGYLGDLMVDMYEDRGFIEISKVVEALEQRGIKAQRKVTPLVSKHPKGKDKFGEPRCKVLNLDGKTYRCLDMRAE
jgi:hypothetical protein